MVVDNVKEGVTPLFPGHLITATVEPLITHTHTRGGLGPLTSYLITILGLAISAVA